MAGDAEEGIVFIMIYPLVFFFRVTLFFFSSRALCCTCLPVVWVGLPCFLYSLRNILIFLIAKQRRSSVSVYAIPPGSLKNLSQRYPLGRVLPPIGSAKCQLLALLYMGFLFERSYFLFLTAYSLLSAPVFSRVPCTVIG